MPQPNLPRENILQLPVWYIQRRGTVFQVDTLQQIQKKHMAEGFFALQAMRSSSHALFSSVCKSQEIPVRILNQKLFLDDLLRPASVATGR
ncbi:hypothetical protein [uncultured Pyramidobacter sp.]|uniref:hypothetical protein n=1 Tax=uncultured Pyramidobacter sp. TaxID=1623495 RepID=UPI0005911EFE|nr:hypothetical protein [uncultured Pyramidobacter sp.]